MNTSQTSNNNQGMQDSSSTSSDSKIITTGSTSARGLDATYGGYIEANIDINYM